MAQRAVTRAGGGCTQKNLGLTCRTSRLNSSKTFCLIPPVTRLYMHKSRSTVGRGASRLISSRIEFSWVARSTPAMRSMAKQMLISRL